MNQKPINQIINIHTGEILQVTKKHKSQRSRSDISSIQIGERITHRSSIQVLKLYNHHDELLGCYPSQSYVIVYFVVKK